MKIENIDFGNFEYEEGLLISENLNFRNINQSLDIWVNTEDNSIAKITEKQFKVFRDFISIDKIELLIQKELIINDQAHTFYSIEELKEFINKEN